jgi:FKBP-type peptidyl-prolyl cis-trans isomerase (trigger factor)
VRKGDHSLKATITDAENGHKRLEVTVPWQDVEADYNDLLGEYRKLSVPGFRPSKAPTSVIESRHRKEIEADFTSRCAQRLSKAACDEQDIMPSGALSISDVTIEKDDVFSFAAEFLPLPEFDLPDYRSMKLKAKDDDDKRDEISEWLLSNTDVPIAEELVSEELAFDDLTAEQGSEEYSSAESRIKLTLILRKIARTDGIEVEDRDVDERIDEMAASNGMKPLELRQEVARSGGLGRLRFMILAEQTLAYLLEM